MRIKQEIKEQQNKQDECTIYILDIPLLLVQIMLAVWRSLDVFHWRNRLKAKVFPKIIVNCSKPSDSCVSGFGVCSLSSVSSLVASVSASFWPSSAFSSLLSPLSHDWEFVYDFFHILSQTPKCFRFVNNYYGI